MTRLNVLSLALACVVSLPTIADAQSTYRTRRTASFDVYSDDVMQARIKAVSEETLALMKLGSMRYNASEDRMSDVEDEAPQFARAGSGYYRQFRTAEIGIPSLYATCAAYEKALESVIRRIDAGEVFDVRSADAFLRQAQVYALMLHRHLRIRERQIWHLEDAASRPRTGMGYIRITGGAVYRY